MTDATIVRTGPDHRAAFRPSTFADVLRSEWTKLRSVRSAFWALTVTAVLGVGRGAAISAAAAHGYARSTVSARLTWDPTGVSLDGLAIASLAIAVLGVLCVSVLAPRLSRRVTAGATEVRLRFMPPDSKEPDLLRNGTLDLDIGIAGVQPADIHTSMLLTDHFVAVVAIDSELGLAGQLTIEDLCARPHISASRRGFARGPLDDALEQIGRSRHVAAVVPSYALGALMVLEGDVICLLPHMMAAHLAERGLPLKLHEVPFALPAVDVELRWHRRLDNDPASQWLRRCVHDAVRPLTAGR